MFIGAIEIRREGYHGNGYGKADPTKPFIIKIETYGSRNKTEMVLSPELSDRILAIVADEVVAAGREAAEAMTVEALNMVALPAPEAA